MPLRAHGAVAALVLVSTLTSGCSLLAWDGRGETPLRPTSTASASDGSGADFVAIRRMLARRATAIERGDRRAFLQGLDPGNAELRRSQLQLFQNLQDLPVDSIAYRSGDFDGAGAAPVAGDAPTLRPDVTEIVRLRDVDRRPVAHELEMTFVRRDDGWLLGAEKLPPENEFRPEGPASRPWFGARIDVAQRGPMLVVTDRQSPSVVDLLADRTDQHLADISSRLGVPNRPAVLVDATSTGLPHEMNSDGAEAAAVFFGASSPDGQHLAGWRIKINPERIDELLDSQLLLRHELTHFVTRDLIRVSPTWVREGLAEYISWQPYGLDSAVFPDSWAARFRRAEREIPNSGQFSANPGINYPVSFAAVTVLVSARGIQGVKELIAAYARAARGTDDYSADWATPEVLRKVYGFGVKELTGRTWALLESNL